MEITGPVDKKMTINALNSGAKVWLADMEDSSTPTWRNVIQGQLNLTDALERRIDFTSPEGKEYKLKPGRGTAHHRGPSPRLAPAGEAHAHRRQADRRRHRGLRPVLLPQRPPPAGPGQGPVLLPAEDREPPRSPAVERHLHPGPGPAGHPAGHHPRHGADRDHHRRVRDGRDPLRTPRPRSGSERRPVGLHLLADQELPYPRPPFRAPGPRPGDHDPAVHARLHRAAGPGLPPRGAMAIGGMAAAVPNRKDEAANTSVVREGPCGQDP